MYFCYINYFVMKYGLYCLICLTFIVNTSCRTTSAFKMDVLTPGYMVANPNVRDIYLVDNTGKQPENYGHKYYEQSKYVSDTSYITDSLSYYLMGFLNDYLAKEAYFNSIGFIGENILDNNKKGSMDFLRAEGLNNAQKNRIRRYFPKGYLVSLDRVIVKTKTNKYTLNSEFNSGVRDVIVNSVWRVIDIEKDTLCLLFQHNDSLFWNRWSVKKSDPLKLIPDFKETIPEIADFIAERVYKIFGPYWETIERRYFISGSYRMTIAQDYIIENNWDRAVGLWEDEYRKGLGNSVYRAAMNIMVYYQTIDDMENSLDWAEKARVKMEKNPFYILKDKDELEKNIKYISNRKLELSLLSL